MCVLVISAYEAATLLAARADGKTSCAASPDLGCTLAEAALDDEGATLNGVLVTWKQVEEISRREHTCFEATAEDIVPIREYSAETRKYYALHATGAAPTMLISGIPMHRIKNTEPLARHGSENRGGASGYRAAYWTQRPGWVTRRFWRRRPLPPS